MHFIGYTDYYFSKYSCQFFLKICVKGISTVKYKQFVFGNEVAKEKRQKVIEKKEK